LCATDSPKYPHFDEETADFAYLRLQNAVTSRKTGYASRDLDLWAERLKVRAAACACFVYFIDGAKERAPAAARALIERLTI
ncbi:MAG TPA: DUF72 domain-containing protein, partial [Beijerinckiaceae bacterium]|nr:DUF72 domain-containing protein [Beijerinckiaceae bacterium]